MAGVTQKDRFEVLRRDGYRCQYCGAGPEATLQVDHVVPVAAGGTDDISNLRTACSACNSGKSSRILSGGERGQDPLLGKHVVVLVKKEITYWGRVEFVRERMVWVRLRSWLTECEGAEIKPFPLDHIYALEDAADRVIVFATVEGMMRYINLPDPRAGKWRLDLKRA